MSVNPDWDDDRYFLVGTQAGAVQLGGQLIIARCKQVYVWSPRFKLVRDASELLVAQILLAILAQLFIVREQRKNPDCERWKGKRARDFLPALHSPSERRECRGSSGPPAAAPAKVHLRTSRNTYYANIASRPGRRSDLHSSKTAAEVCRGSDRSQSPTESYPATSNPRFSTIGCIVCGNKRKRNRPDGGSPDVRSSKRPAYVESLQRHYRARDRLIARGIRVFGVAKLLEIDSAARITYRLREGRNSPIAYHSRKQPP